MQSIKPPSMSFDGDIVNPDLICNDSKLYTIRTKRGSRRCKTIMVKIYLSGKLAKMNSITSRVMVTHK